MFVHIELILMPQNLQILLRCLYEHSSCIFWRFCTSLKHALHPDIQPPVYSWTSHKCSGSSAFSQNIYLSISLVFFRLSTHSQDMYYIYFRHFRHSAPLCTSGWCSRCFPFFYGIYPTTRAVFFWIFRTLPGHVVHLAYLFRVFQTFSSSFMCAHAPEVPHFFRRFTRALWLFFFRIFRTHSGHALHLTYLFQIFRTFSIWFLCAHAPEVPHFLRTFTWALGLFVFGYSGHSQDMYYIWHIYFRYFGHSASDLFVHMLRKFRIFSGHLPKH